MADPLEQELILDVSGALQAIQSVDDALAQVAANFETALTAAVETLSATPLSVDTSALTDDLQAALAQAQEPIPVEADTTALEGEIVAAVDTSATIPVDADTGDATAAIDAIAGEPITVPVDANTAEATAAIDSLNTSPVTVEVDADTSQAQDAIDAVGVSATRAAGSAGGEGLAGLEGALVGIKAATASATGEVGGLTSEVGGLSAGLGGAAAAGTAFAAFIGETVKVAADAQAQQARFNATFGETADVVEHIDVGGLTTSLEELGKQSGTTRADLEASATRIGLLGAASGAAQPEVAKTASSILGLAGALSVSNPRFGDAATVADTVSRALSTGRTRSLIPYGISLSQTAIAQEALNETQKTSVSDLTGYEKLVAGLTLALAQQGDTLGTKYAEGVQNAQVQLRALKVQLEEALVAVGTPLLAPVTASLQELLPVAISVGQVLGELAQIVVPLLGALGPPLELLATGLGFVADGVHAVGEVLHAIAGPLGIAVVGLGALTVAYDTGAIAAFSFGAAVDVALGPVGLIIGALTVLGGLGALGGLGDKTKEVAVDTSALSAAFTSTATSGDSFTGTVENINSALDKFLATQLAVGDAGKQPADAVDALGLSIGDLKGIISGTDNQFADFVLRLSDSPSVTKDNVEAFTALDTTIHKARDQLEAGAHATLTNALQTGLLTKANVGSARAWADLNAESGGAIATLERFSPITEAATARQTASAKATAIANDAFTGFATGIADGTIGVGSLQAQADLLGVTLKDVTTIFDDQTKAIVEQQDATLLASDASTRLRSELAAGQITARQAEIAFLNLGVSLPGTTKAITDTGTAIGAFTTSALGSLPKVSDAISTFSKTITSDFQKVADDTKNHTGDIRADLKRLAEDQSPQKFVDNLRQQVTDIQHFEDLLKVIVAEGGTAVAAEIAKQGPAAGGAAAAAIASDPGGVKTAEALISQGNAAKDAYVLWLKTTFGVEVGAEMAREAGIVVRQYHPDLQAPTQAAIAGIAQAAAGASPQVKDAIRRLSEGGAAAFNPDLATPAQRAALAAGNAIHGNTNVKKESGDKGKAASDEFGNKTDLPGEVKKAFEAAAVIIPQLTSIATKAGTAGHAVGVAFDSGMVEGINSPDGIARINSAASAAAAGAEAAANATLGIKSPSTVGIKIGNQFVEGIVVGLTATTGITESGAGLATRISTATTASLSGLGPQLLGNIVAGFNDPATIDAGIKRLQDLIARATTRSAAASASSTFSQFVSSVISQVPAGAAAISTFGSNVSQAASAQASAFTEAHKAFANYAADQREHRALLAGLIPATQALDAANAKLFNDTLANRAPITLGFDKAQVRDAQQAVDDLTRKLDQSVQSMIANHQAVARTSGVLSAAQQALAAASSPDAFIRNLNRQTAANRDFQHNLRLLSADGANELARQLAQAGPDAAGKLAAALAASPAKALQAQAALVAADAFTKSYQTYITQQFAPKVTAAVSGIAGAVYKPLGDSIISSSAAGAQKALIDIRSRLSVVPSVIKVFADTSAVTTTVGAALPPNAIITVRPTVEALPDITFPVLSVAVQPHVVLPLPALEPLHVDVIPNLLPLPSATVATVTAPQPVATVATPATFGGTQTLELDLTIQLPSGQEVVASKTLQIPSGQGKQVISAAVAAKVKA